MLVLVAFSRLIVLIIVIKGVLTMHFQPSVVDGLSLTVFCLNILVKVLKPTVE